jgi:hypothetical protein
MATFNETAKLIDQIKMLNDGKGLEFLVVITDVREVWGKTQCLVQPQSGNGERWVDLASLSSLR